MEGKSLPHYTILDIIKLKRKAFSIVTENKRCYVLSCRLNGEGIFSWQKRKATVQSGDVLYIPRGASYSQRSLGEEVICIHLEIEGHVSNEMEVFSSPDTHAICTLFRRVWAVWESKPAGYEYICLSLLYRIIAMSGAAASKAPALPDVLNPALTYLSIHVYDTDFSLTSLYEVAHIGRKSFNKYFRLIYAVTPSTYVRMQRMNRAKQLFKNGGYTNEEIATLCGFEDVKYFYTVFKKTTGMTTGEYKRTIRRGMK